MNAPPARRRIRVTAVVMLALGVLALLTLYADVRRLWTSLGAFSWWAFGAALVLSTTNYAVRFLRWTLYLRWLEVRVPTAASLRIFVSGFLFSVSPGKVGEVYKSMVLQRERGVPLVRTGPIVVAERLTDLLALILLASFGALVFSRGQAVVLAGLALVLAVLAVASSERLAAALLALLARAPGIQRVTPALAQAHGSLRSLVRPVRLVVPTALATVAWSMECFAFWLVLRGFAGVSFSVEAATFAYAASTIAGAVTMVPGGLGVTELGLAGLVETLGRGQATPAVAVGATLLVRLATLWWAVGLGAFAAWLSRRRQADRPDDRTATTNAPAPEAR